MTVAVVVMFAAAITLVAEAALPAEVASLMDPSTDPCDDFHQYACGGWIDNYTLPTDVDAYAHSFNSLNERNERVIREILQHDWPLIGELFDSCMAVDESASVSCELLRKDLTRIYNADTKTELARLAGALAMGGAPLFIDVAVAPHVNDSSRNALHVGNADMVLPATGSGPVLA